MVFYSWAFYYSWDWPLHGNKMLWICLLHTYVHCTHKFKYRNIVAAFRGMHVSPAKHSYAWLSRKCDYRTDRHTHTQTDAGQSDPYVPLCFAGDKKSFPWHFAHLHFSLTGNENRIKNKKYNNTKRSIPAHPTYVNDTHRACDPYLWNVTSKINMVYHG